LIEVLRLTNKREKPIIDQPKQEIAECHPFIELSALPLLFDASLVPQIGLTVCCGRV
jgi:hypothetical protein